MKTKLTFLLLIFSFPAFSQTGKQKTVLFVTKTSCFFFAGAFEGTKDAIDFHYKDFKKVFPNANDQFCNPDLSWKNKYKNGDPQQGEAFPFSSTLLVSQTDLWHKLNRNRNVCFVVGASIPLNGKIDVKQIALEIVSYYSAYLAGKYLTYDLIF